MRQNQPDIGLMLTQEFPSVLADQFVENFEALDIDVAVERHSGGPYAGVALYLPTAVMIFIASAYFGGAFKKMGEEHYLALTKAIPQMWHRVRNIKVSAIGNSTKTQDFNKYQLVFSIIGALDHQINFKFILSSALSDKDAETGILCFLDFLKEMHTDCIDDKLLSELLAYRPVGGTVLVTFDGETQRLVPIDGRSTN